MGKEGKRKGKGFPVLPHHGKRRGNGGEMGEHGGKMETIGADQLNPLTNSTLARPDSLIPLEAHLEPIFASC